MINIFNYKNKFYVDNCFTKPLLNLIKKINLLYKIKFDNFLQKIIALNILSLKKSKKVYFQTLKAIYYGNCSSIIVPNIDSNFFIKILFKIISFNS